MEQLVFFTGWLLVFAIPVWAAWITWQDHKLRAASATIGWTTTWVLFLLWLAT